MRIPLRLAAVAGVTLALAGTSGATAPPEPPGAGTAVRGWTILSNSEPDALAVIAAAPAYGINHLQLSHQVVEDLTDLRDAARQQLVERLIAAAHGAGIREVLLWAKPPAGQWNWVEDADAAMRYYELITRTGWPAETRGVANPYAGKTFPLEAQ